MATRSIKLKLVVGGDSDEAFRLRRAIWTTHRIFNDGVRYYMQWLMRMRQRPITDEDAPKEDILVLAREAQRANGAPDCPGSDDEIRALLKNLYEAIVPSSVDKKGDANQISRKYHSILVDPTSEGGLGKSKTGRRPRWMSLPDGPEKEALREEYEAKKKEDLKASPLIRLKELRVLPLFPAFNRTRPAWIATSGKQQKSALTRGDRDMFQQAVERLMSWESWTRRVEAERRKKQLKLDELEQDVVQTIPEAHKRLREYEADRQARLGRDAFLPDQPFRINERMIRGWEDLQDRWLKLPPSDRSEDRLKKIIADLQTERRGRFGDASDFFPWLARPENHFLWDGTVAKTAIRQHVIFNEAKRSFECAKEFANYTPPDALEHPLWARSGHSGDRNIHQYHIHERDGKLKAKIRLYFEDDEGRVFEKDVEFDVKPSAQWNSPQRGDTPPIRIVPFDQVPAEFRSGQKNEPDCTWIRFTDPGTNQVLYGTLGGARLQLERSDFRLGSDLSADKMLREMAFASGQSFPRVYLNVSVSLPDPPGIPAHLVFKRTRKAETDPLTAVDYLLKEDGKKACLEELDLGGRTIAEGLRVMAVDLGVRQLAACSVFELTRAMTPGKVRIPVAGADGLFMEHRRSFLLKLPGEEDTPEVRNMREHIREQRLVLRAAINRLKQLLSLGRLDDPIKKREEFDALRGSDQRTAPERRRRVDQILDPSLLQHLDTLIKDKPNDPRWPDEVLKVHRMWEAALGAEIHKWRRETRGAGRKGTLRGYGGLSLWHIEELENARKLLNAWSCHSREYETDESGAYKTREDGQRIPKVVRPKKRFGLKPGETPQGQDIDARLLAHINRLKEDRLKVGADMIVMAALGYEYADSRIGWVQKHAPCQMVLFEDLSRYRFKTDRPRSENRQLMKWAHREIPRTVAMQGEIFGLTIGTVAAEFSSRFRASSKHPTPGIRCRRVTDDDLKTQWFCDIIKQLNARAGRPENTMPRQGDLIPWEGGEWFCTLNADGSLYRIHADLNAAQNLMRRFWRRYADTFRLRCRQVRLKDGTLCWVPEKLAIRLPRALKYDFGQEAVRLIPWDPGDPEQGCRLEPIPMKDYRKIMGSKPAGKPEGETEHDDVESAHEELAELRGDFLTFFRDPSGIVVPKRNGQDLWLPAKVFWGRVNRRIAAKLQAVAGQSIEEDTEDTEDELPFF
ncbi:MAG: hypothetical protein Kow0059_07620 [Candidatus Sumerlaeia bacterium]